jgi:putative endonuclease
MFFMYVLQSEQTGQYYIGSTKDVSLQLAQHNAGRTPSTKGYCPWKVIYTEAYDTLREARQRERKVKSWKNPGYMARTLGFGS